MNLMLCLRGEPEQLPFLPEIAALGAGIELGSYGLVGVRSEHDWWSRLALHQAVRQRFAGPLAIHGPFLGMEFAHLDHLVREAVQRRLDLTFDAALALNARRVVLHSGFTMEIDFFQLFDTWLAGNAAFWRREVSRWASAGIQAVLENDTEQSPDPLVRLVDAVDNPYLGLCLDVGHQHVFSDLGALEWVRRMGPWLAHVHLHDNDGTADRHWPLGYGTIAFEPFFAAVREQAPQAALSLEVEDTMEVKMADLRRLADQLSLYPKI